MRTIYKIKNTLHFIIVLFMVLSCKDTLSKGQSINNIGKGLNEEQTNIPKDSNLTLWELIDVQRFFGKAVEEVDLETLKNYNVSFKSDTIIIDNKKAKFSRGEIDSQKMLGKGSLYDYYTEYVKKKYNIDVTKKFSYLDIDINDASKQPFSKFFLKSGGALYTNNYLFLYASDDYLLVYKKTVINIVVKTLYNKIHNPSKANYQQIKNSTMKDLEKYSCGESFVRYIELPNKNSIRLILVPQDCGDFNYRYYLITIKDNKVIGDLYVEGEWYEPEDSENTEYTSFKIDTNFDIEVATKIKNNIRNTKYGIDSSGKIFGK